MIIKEINNISYTSEPSGREYGRLILPLRSSFKLTAGGKTYELTDGMAAVLSPGEFCAINKNETARLLLIAFTAEGEVPTGAFFLSEQEELLADTLLSLDGEDSRIRPLIEFLLLSFAGKESAEPLAIARDAALFADAADLLQEKVGEAFSVDALAAALGISLSHLKRIFARYAGKGAHDYFNDLKIAYAKELLQSGHSVTQTAALAGFANQAYFSAAFKRITGQNPKEFSAKGKAPAAPSPAPRKRTAPKPAPQARRDLPSYLL